MNEWKIKNISQFIKYLLSWFIIGMSVPVTLSYLNRVSSGKSLSYLERGLKWPSTACKRGEFGSL